MKLKTPYTTGRMQYDRFHRVEGEENSLFDNIVYAIVATKKLATFTRNATTKNIANIILATIIGHLNTFCNTIDIITAIGSAK